jgi:hypothetical protein
MHTTVLLSDLPLLVLLRIRQFDALWRERRREVTYCNRCVRNWGIDGGFIGVVPVSAGNAVALVDIHFVSVLRKFAVGDEASDMLVIVILVRTIHREVDIKPTHPTPVPITATRLMGHLNW